MYRAYGPSLVHLLRHSISWLPVRSQFIPLVLCICLARRICNRGDRLRMLRMARSCEYLSHFSVWQTSTRLFWRSFSDDLCFVYVIFPLNFRYNYGRCGPDAVASYSTPRGVRSHAGLFAEQNFAIVQVTSHFIRSVPCAPKLHKKQNKNVLHLQPNVKQTDDNSIQYKWIVMHTECNI